LVSSFLSTQHKEIAINTDQLVEALETAMLARDLPGMADVDTSLYLFCREIKKEATVALSGECSDEIFGGYPWFFNTETQTTATGFPWSRNLSERMDLLSPDLIKQIQPNEYISKRYWEALQEVPRLAEEQPEEAQMRELFYLNITRWMPTLLDRKDRMSMATGLEVRVPFCDHHLVEYVWNIPWAIKYCDQREKGILRRALSGMLPDDVLTRRKSPFPKTHNPDYLEAMRQWMLRILDNSNSPLLPLINSSAIRNFIQPEQANINLPWFGQLMNVPQLFAYLIQIEIWLKRYRVIIV
jgi:asparagine synthase (glutamine-hydrolysing)